MSSTTMPDLLREIVAYCREAGHDWSSLTEAEHMLTTLQAQPAAEVSVAEIDRIYDRMFPAPLFHEDRVKVRKFVRAILALRPQAVPMTEDEFVACLTKANCIGVVKMSYDSGPYGITRPSINASKLKEAFEAHHGITAPAGGEGKA